MPDCATTGSPMPDTDDAEREVRAGVDGEGVRRGEHVPGHRLQCGAGDTEREADDQPATARGKREATTTDASAPSTRPVRAFQTSATPTFAVPWVVSTAASTATSAIPATRSRTPSAGRATLVERLPARACVAVPVTATS